MWLNILLFIAFCLFLTRFIFKTIISLHIFQLEGYKNKRLIKWAIKHPERAYDKESFITGFFLLFIGLFLENFRLPILFLILWIFVGGWIFIRCKRKKQKKPLVWTGRVKRLFFLSILLYLFILGIVFYLTQAFSILFFFLASFIFLQFAFINLILANILLFPLQASINFYYFTKAKRKIRRMRPKVIGITGSYGKTSVKHILGNILSKKYRTLITQESYNTLQGICRVINERLKEEHDVFVVEMGAYKRGDIKELCKLVKPEIGILTGITTQHLERFKTLENIKLAKFEIIENLPSFGIAIVNCDDENTRSIMDKIEIKKIGYSISKGGDVIAQDIELDASGTKFTVLKTHFQTRLLGRHSVLNILAGICVGIELSIDMEKIKEAVCELNFIPHRLQLTKTTNNVFILDDSYNSNPIGAYEALSVLSLFEKNRKILVTPGMIELGDIEYTENKKFGIKAAKICNLVILVGEKRTTAILDGLKEKGFPEENTIVVDSLDKAKERLERITQSNDCILFENDLPDTYNEG